MDTTRTLRSHIGRCLGRNLLIVGLVASAGVVADATTEQARMPMPAGVSECWNGATAQITTVVGKCP